MCMSICMHNLILCKVSLTNFTACGGVIDIKHWFRWG